MSAIALLISAALFQTVSAATAPPLGTATSFAVLGGSTVTNTGLTIVTGDLGVSPGTAITGFPPGVVIGTIHANDAVAMQAHSDATTAYNALASQACNTVLTGTDLGGLTLIPGVYCFASSAQLTGTLTLDAQGDPNAVWVFQIGSTLTTASNSAVNIINGGSACNAFWQVGSSATLGTNTAFKGNILGLASITLTTGVSMSGRVLALTGAVTMDTNTVDASICNPGPLAADLAITKTHVGTFTQLGTGTYTITVTNTGTAPTAGTVTVVDTLPIGLTATAIGGPGWTCILGTLTCTRADALAAGLSYPPITLTVNVLCTATGTVVNSVTVTNPNVTADADDTANDPTIIIANAMCTPAPPDLAITKTHVGNFTRGQVGATYTITVINTGTAATTGITTVTDTLPAGLTFVSGSGGGFTCSAVGQIVTCTDPAAIPGGASAVITLTVNVAANAPAVVTNTVTVTNPSIVPDPDDTATDMTTIATAPAPDLAISKTHVGNFTQGQVGATYTLRVTNTGTAPTVGTTTVVDTLPAGLTFVSGSGGGFTCSAVAQVVTCTHPAAIPAGASRNITLTVNVAANAPAMVTNTATVTNPNIAFDADDTVTDPTIIAPALDGTYQLRYLANLDKGDSYVNLTNAGTLNGFDPAGRLCVNVYTFDPAEELISCCACPVTPNGLASLSARNDLIGNTLTPGVPTSITVKLLSSLPIAGVCNAASPNAANLVRGLRAWATTLHLNTSTLPAPGVYQHTETPFSAAELSPSELSKLTSFCAFIQANGSGFGICKSCRVGALGAEQK